MIRATAAVLLVACASYVPPAQFAQINRGGEAVKVEDSVVPGYVTLVDFSSELCKPCKIAERKIREAVENDSRILVRKVDIGDVPFTPVARAYGVTAVPRWQVYDTRARLRFDCIGGDCWRVPQVAENLLGDP